MRYQHLIMVGMILGIGILSPVFGNSYMESIDASTLLSQSEDPIDEDDADAVIEAFQTMFIKTSFVRPAFQNSHRFYGDDEDGNGVAGSEVVNELMMTELARMLAEQDMFHLKEIIKRGIDARQK